MIRHELPGKLLAAWLHQKSLVLKRAGMPPNVMQWDRAVAVWGGAMEKLAQAVEPWDVAPGLLMEAVFASSRRKGHSQGPFINALQSERFLKQALSEHLDIPMERVLTMTRTAAIVAAIDKDYARSLPSMLEIASLSEQGLFAATTFPAAYRFFLLSGLGAPSMNELRTLAVDTIEEIEHDHRVLLWLESRGVTFASLADTANAGVIASPSHSAAVDLLRTAARLLSGDQAVCVGKDLHQCKDQAKRLLEKALTLLE